MMIRQSAVLAFAIVLFGLGINWSARAQESSAGAVSATAKPEGVVAATVVTVHGKISQVNKSRKQVTLELPGGQEVTLDVRNPYNLEQAKVGVPFVARYYEIVTIRKKRPDESVPSASLKTGIATAQPGGVPGAVGEVHARILLTV